MWFRTRLASACLFLAAATPAFSAPAIELQLVAGGLSSPVDIRHANDGSGRLFIVERAGRILILEDGVLRPTPFLDIQSRVLCCGERGLLGAAFHPGYAANGWFFVNYTGVGAGETVIARYQVSAGDPNIADPSSEQVLLTIPQPASNHNGGQLQFGPDGFLYVATGDGGGGGDPQDAGQNLGSLLGKILRIDVDGGGSYAVPPDNPFVGDAGARDEIWAYGLRNPWRFSFDRSTGDMFIADVGQGSWEEVSFQPSTSVGGENYGWRCREGAHDFNTSGCGGKTFVDPVLEYSHSEGCSITGGYRYRGFASPGLLGYYFYGDFCSGRIWGAYQSGASWVSSELLASGLSISTFGEDELGEIFVAELGGDLYRIVATLPDELTADLTGEGLWLFENDTWTNLTSWDTTELERWDGSLAAQFDSGQGLWLFDGQSWTIITSWSPELVVAHGPKLVCAFGNGRGLWQFASDRWSQLTPADPYAVVSYKDEIVAAFHSPRGTFFHDGTAWGELTSLEPAEIAPFGDKLVAAFGNGAGLWTYEAGNWTSLTAWDPERLETRGRDLILDFGTGRGIWRHDASGWRELTSWTSDELESADLF